MFDLVPFNRGERNLWNALNHFEKNFFNDFPSAVSDIKTDIIDKGDHYILEAELPGFEKDDIKIDVDGDYLIIRAEHNAEKEDKKHHYLRQERSYCTISRSFNISDVKENEIKAEYKNGLLKLNLPKAEGASPKSHSIHID